MNICSYNNLIYMIDYVKNDLRFNFYLSGKLMEVVILRRTIWMSLLVIGANGGVGSKLVKQLKEDQVDFTPVYVKTNKLKH